MKHNILIFIVFQVAIMASCNPSALIPFEELREVPRELEGQVVFSVGGSLLEVEPGTKALPVVIENFDSGFNVSCVKGTPGSDVSVWTSTLFEKAGSVWSGGKWWPDTDESYRFYAVYPSTYAITFNAAGSTITASSADDVVVAYCSSSVFGEVNELQFGHIFARLGNVTVQGFDGYDITNVSITVIPYLSGTYNMRTGEWSGKTAGSSTVIAESLGSNSNDRYMVPGGYKFKATWTATHGSYSETFSAVSTRVSLSAGYVNNFTIKLGGNGPEVCVDVSLSDWEATALNAGYFPLKMPPTFGGLMIAPAPLYYDGTYFVIKDDDWNHTSYGSSTGRFLQEGSYYFTKANLQTYFGGSGSEITNSQTLSYGGYSDWRVPSLNDWKIIFRTEGSRVGSTVNGNSGKHYSYLNVEGLTFGSASYVRGMLIYPDDKIITGATISYFDGYSNMSNLTAEQLNQYLSQGCAFIPYAGYYYTQYSGWYYLNSLGPYIVSDSSARAFEVNKVSNASILASDCAPVYLVRNF